MDWMKQNSKDASSKPSLVPPQMDTTQWITKEELKTHRTTADAWISIRGVVYDVTSYMQFHPGGAKILLASCGRDSTDLFDRHHRWVDASYLLGSKRVGRLQVNVE